MSVHYYGTMWYLAISFCMHCGPMMSGDPFNFEFFSGSKTTAGSAIHKTQWKVLPY